MGSAQQCDILVTVFIYSFINICVVYVVEMFCLNNLSESEYQIGVIMLNIFMWKGPFEPPI